MKTAFVVMWLLAGLFLYLPNAVADSPFVADTPYEVTFGDYTVNYSVYPSRFLQAEMAKALKIRQSPNLGVITVAARQMQLDGEELPVRAAVRVRTRSMLGRVSSARLREVEDDGHVYYLGSFSITQNESTHFEIEVVPEGSEIGHKFTFSRRF